MNRKPNRPSEEEFKAALEHSKRVVLSEGDGKAVKYRGRPANNPFAKKNRTL